MGSRRLAVGGCTRAPACATAAARCTLKSKKVESTVNLQHPVQDNKRRKKKITRKKNKEIINHTFFMNSGVKMLVPVFEQQQNPCFCF